MSVKVVKYTYDEQGRQSWSFEDIPEEAPDDNKDYIRKGKQWVESVYTSGTPTGDSNIDGGKADTSFTGSLTLDGNT